MLAALNNSQIYINRTIVDVIEELSKNILKKNTFDMVVRRSHILTDALHRMESATFDPTSQLNVCYVKINGVYGI